MRFRHSPFRQLRRSHAAAPGTPPGERIYAIGDIHGCFGLMLGLLARIKADHLTRGQGKRGRIVILGDFVDRGPDSAAVMRKLHALQHSGARITVLLGNHEHLLQLALAGDGAAQAGWLRSGGDRFLDSFGLAGSAGADPVDLAASIGQAMGDDLVDWLRSLPVSIRLGDYFFCHAGVEPGVAIADQDRETLLTIRRRFMESEADHGAVIVHGHNYVRNAQIRPNRISIDTRGYQTGLLSAVGLDGTECWPLEFRAEEGPAI